jgi:hypothetical protein
MGAHQRYLGHVPQRLFVFVQIELPQRLGPAYLIRARPGGEPQHVVVLNTGGAKRADQSRPRRWDRLRRSKRKQEAWRGKQVPAMPASAPAATTRATVIDPVSLSAERQAQAWLDSIEPASQISATFAVLNRVLFAHRISGADPSVFEVSPDQALTIRAGWGFGEEVANGRWSYARELHWSQARPRRRVAALRPQERFSALLGARGEALICEELALRARLDLDHGRPRHAALELERAYAAALFELRAAGAAPSNARGRGPSYAERLSELEQLHSGVIEAATAALRDRPADGGARDQRPQVERPGQTSSEDQVPDEEVVRHALARLEAALRARAAGM